MLIFIEKKFPYLLHSSRAFWYCLICTSNFWLSYTQDLYLDSRSDFDSSISRFLFDVFWLISSRWLQANIAFSLHLASSVSLASRSSIFSWSWDFSFSPDLLTSSRYKQRTSKFWFIFLSCPQLLSRSRFACSSLIDLFFICSQVFSKTLHLACSLWIAASSILTGSAWWRFFKLSPTSLSCSQILSISASKWLVISFCCRGCFSPLFPWWPLWKKIYYCNNHFKCNSLLIAHTFVNSNFTLTSITISP